MIPQRTGALPPWRAHRDCSCRRLSPELLRFFSVMGKSGRNASRSDRILIVLCSICACSLMCLEFQGWTLIGPNFKILNWKLFCKSNFLSEFANLKSSAARTKAELTFSIQANYFYRRWDGDNCTSKQQNVRHGYHDRLSHTHPSFPKFGTKKPPFRVAFRLFSFEILSDRSF